MRIFIRVWTELWAEGKRERMAMSRYTSSRLFCRDCNAVEFHIDWVILNHRSHHLERDLARVWIKLPGF